MKIRIGFFHKGKILGEYFTDVSDPDHLSDGAKLAFEEFRFRCPKVSLLDDEVMVSFSKVGG
jgi:hypothetical protein